ncbi:MAG: MmpS family transport accessory protein [Mycobacterium sp.]|uniref:MmpS family transport accessory protein n=1 Tax=Mycobacterium sp. TaxID=1785 RepID=UPI003C71F5F9
MADIGYFEATSDPHRADAARLPWPLQIAAKVSAVVGNVIAHSDNNSVGCRMVVNGQVEAERISNDVNAYTQCTVKGA